MIPYSFFFIVAFPVLSSRKTDYASLLEVEPFVLETERDSDGIHLNSKNLSNMKLYKIKW